MRLLNVISPLLCSLLLLNSVTLAFETDQFNLPKVPLADIGEEVSEHVVEVLQTTVDKLNAEIAKTEKCLEIKTKGCDSPDKLREKLRQGFWVLSSARLQDLLLEDGILNSTVSPSPQPEAMLEQLVHVQMLHVR